MPGQGQLKRRGLVAGLAALAAGAVAKLTSRTAEASHGGTDTVDATALHVDEMNVGRGTTQLEQRLESGALSVPAIQVVRHGGVGSSPVVAADSRNASNIALHGVALRGDSLPELMAITVTARPVAILGETDDGIGAVVWSARGPGALVRSVEGHGLIGGTALPLTELLQIAEALDRRSAVVGIAGGQQDVGGQFLAQQGVGGQFATVNGRSMIASTVLPPPIALSVTSTFEPTAIIGLAGGPADTAAHFIARSPQAAGLKVENPEGELIQGGGAVRVQGSLLLSSADTGGVFLADRLAVIAATLPLQTVTTAINELGPTAFGGFAAGPTQTAGRFSNPEGRLSQGGGALLGQGSLLISATQTAGLFLSNAGAAVVGATGQAPLLPDVWDAGSSVALVGMGPTGAVLATDEVRDFDLLFHGPAAGARIVTRDVTKKGLFVSSAGAGVISATGQAPMMPDFWSEGTDVALVGMGPTGAVLATDEVDDPTLLFGGTAAGLRAVTTHVEKTGIDVMHGGDGTAFRVLRGRIQLATDRSAVFPTGATSFLVQDRDVTNRSHIIVTFMSDAGNATLNWVERIPGVGFIVHVSNRLRDPAELCYLLVEGAG